METCCKLYNKVQLQKVILIKIEKKEGFILIIIFLNQFQFFSILHVLYEYRKENSINIRFFKKIINYF